MIFVISVKGTLQNIRNRDIIALNISGNLKF